MKVRLRSVAKADAAEAIQWYAEQKPGLDARFLEALSLTLRNIEQNPTLYPDATRPFPQAVPVHGAL
jgi:hypothetical protein